LTTCHIITHVSAHANGTLCVGCFYLRTVLPEENSQFREGSSHWNAGIPPCFVHRLDTVSAVFPFKFVHRLYVLATLVSTTSCLCRPFQFVLHTQLSCRTPSPDLVRTPVHLSSFTFLRGYMPSHMIQTCFWYKRFASHHCKHTPP